MVKNEMKRNIWDQLGEIGRAAPDETWEEYQAQIEATNSPCAGTGGNVNVMGWMPIETAPVATRLMFWWRPIKPNPYAECCVIGNLCYQSETGERNGKWWNEALGGEQDIWHLTHWMPLPDAPNV